METRIQRSKMSQSCLLCFMTYNNKRNEMNRPLQLCQKIIKNCKEYITEDELGETFIKLDCKRKALPLCSRCFVTTEKLCQLSDQLEEIRAQIMDLVESFKVEFLKSREIISTYNSTKITSKAGNNNHNPNTAQVEVKEETILEDSSPDSELCEPVENDDYANEILIKNVTNEDILATQCFSDLLALDVKEKVAKTSSKRHLMDAELSDSDLNSEKSFSSDPEKSGKKWDSSSSSDKDPSFHERKRRKKKVIKRGKTRNRNSICKDLYSKPNFTLKPEMAVNFIYKGHVVGSDLLVLTCKLCQQDKRGNRGGELCHFRRHLRTKHANGEKTKVAKRTKGKRGGNAKTSPSDDILEQRKFKILPSLSDHFKYKGHIVNTRNAVMTCKYCGEDKKGQDSQNFTKHLKRLHSKECDLTSIVINDQIGSKNINNTCLTTPTIKT